MSNDKYYDGVLAYITEHGETGVNELAKAIDIPLSTMQRYLVGQTYFRKTVSRKWDIPNNVDADIKSNTMTLMVESVEVSLKLLESQIAEVHSQVKNALLPVNTLKRGLEMLNAPVAGISGEKVDIDPRLLELTENAAKLTKAVKKQKEIIPDIYFDLLLNCDLVSVYLRLGSEYAEKVVKEEVYPVLIGQSKELDEDTLEILKMCQKS